MSPFLLTRIIPNSMPASFAAFIERRASCCLYVRFFCHRRDFLSSEESLLNRRERMLKQRRLRPKTAL